MSYESPIRIMDNSYESVSDVISKHVAEGVDNLVVEAVVNVGVHVDKDELEKALRYDRGQYEKGYEDGKRDAMPKRGEWKPFDLTYGRSIYSCSVCEQATEVPMCMEKPMYAYCPNCGAKMTEVQDGNK